MQSSSGRVVRIRVFRKETVSDYFQCAKLLWIVLKLWSRDERGRVFDVFVSNPKIIEEEEVIVVTN
jgi:hypothetical protein